MDMLVSWLVSLVAGSAGGNVIGALLKNKSLGPKLNTILGLVGGVVGGQVLGNKAYNFVPPVTDLVSKLGLPDLGGNAGLSAIVGILLPLIVSFLKKPATAA